LAFAAWTYPDASGYRPLPELHIACTGIAPQATKEQWLHLAQKAAAKGRMPAKRNLFGKQDSLLSSTLANALEALYDLFAQAPILGSLIDPRKISNNLYQASYESLAPLLGEVFKAEGDDEARERAIAAAGMVKAADLLAGEYTLIVTNVPYLGFKRQSDPLRRFCESHYPASQSGLETAFAERAIQLLRIGGSLSLVVNQTWLFQPSSCKLREKLLDLNDWSFIVRLGARAFETIFGDVVNVALVMLLRNPPHRESRFAYLNAQEHRSAIVKAENLRHEKPSIVVQANVRNNPSSVITDLPLSESNLLLSRFAISASGLKTGDRDHFNRQMWEIALPNNDWDYYQVASKSSDAYSGRNEIIFWENGNGQLAALAEEVRHLNHVAQNWKRGQVTWQKRGVAVSAVGAIQSHLYDGDKFDSGVTVICPENAEDLAPIWAYCKSDKFVATLRAVDSKISITTSTILKVEFPKKLWENASAKKYPDGLPEPESDDPTQWLFHGRPDEAQEGTELQVAVARLLGYRWPAELDDKMRLSKRARQLAKSCDNLLEYADKDGIVCIPSVRGEEPAAERLLRLLTACDIKPNGDLDDWLRNSFFEEHCKLFHDRRLYGTSGRTQARRLPRPRELSQVG
jgi:hypothetical protein